MRDDQFRALMIASLFPAFYPRLAAVYGDTPAARDGAIRAAKDAMRAIVDPPAPQSTAPEPQES